MMDLSKLKRPLAISDIDFRIQSINKGGYATILAYKDARVDMIRLDEACGPLGWKREHSRDNKNCTVSIWDEITKQWISKEDTGTESSAEAAKGLASDSFKRACFNWGIGRELYDYPIISIKLVKGDEWDLSNGKPKQTYGLNLRNWKWFSEFDESGRMTRLACRDDKGKVRYNKVIEPITAPKATEKVVEPKAITSTATTATTKKATKTTTKKATKETTKKDSVKDDSEREDLLLAINDCKDRASLAKLWNENSKLQTTDWFRTAFTIKGKEFSK